MAVQLGLWYRGVGSPGIVWRRSPDGRCWIFPAAVAAGGRSAAPLAVLVPFRTQRLAELHAFACRRFGFRADVRPGKRCGSPWAVRVRLDPAHRCPV